MKLSTTQLFSVGYLFFAFFLRPSALGSNYTYIGIGGTLFLTLIYLLLNLKSNIKSNTIGSNLIVLFVFLFFIFYEISVSLYQGASNLTFLAGDFITQLIIFSCFLIFLLNKDNNRVFFRYFVILISFFGWSSLISLILFNMSSPEIFLIYNFQMNDYPHTGDIVEAGQIYFPFSMTYDDIFKSDLVSLFRFSGFFRESGIFAAVCSFAFIYSAVMRFSKKILLGHFLGIFLAFSTSGFFVFFIGILGLYLFNNKTSILKNFLIMVVASISLYATFQAPLVGLSYKASTEGFSESVDRRSYSLIEGLKKASKNPFGAGMYSAKTENTGVNLIANIGSIGVIGFLLQVMLMSGFRFSIDRIFKIRLLILSPVLLTILLAQSIATTPFMYILIFIRPSLESTE